MRFSSLIVLAVAAVILATSPAEAQRRRRTPPTTTTTPTTPTTTPPAAEAGSRDQEARMLFEAGRVAYAAGRFEDSLDYFQRAHAMSGRDVLLYNVASAADKLRRDAVALDAFRRYLEAVPTAENRSEVESRIHVLEEVVAAEAARATPTHTEPIIPPTTGEPVTTPPTDETQHEGALNASLQVGGAGNDDMRDDRGGIFTKWWFWTIVGVVVVGGAVGVAIAASSGGGLGPFMNGDDGSVVLTLRAP